MARWHYVFIFLWATINPLMLKGALQEVKADKEYSASIIIPCDPKHAVHLFSLLGIYEQQTCLPDEVVISLSELPRVSNDILDRLQDELWAFPVTLICSSKRIFAGENRNRACRQALSDIFICQDADDIPHPQRVEIITCFFQKYNLDFLMHGFNYLNEREPLEFEYYSNFESIDVVNPRRYEINFQHGLVTNGNIALTRNAFKIVQWPKDRKGQDVKYNKMLFNYFENRLVLKASLYFYRNYLSSWGNYYSNLVNGEGGGAGFFQGQKAHEKKHKVHVIYTD